jgi:hypothetical protein
MSLSFPNSPSIDQIYTQGQKSWRWSGKAWYVVASTANSFGAIAVPGQDNVQANAPSGNLTLIGENGLIITTDPDTDTVTFTGPGEIQPGGGDLSSSIFYIDPPWITSLSKAKVGLSNVDNESKATMFTNPAFTGVVTGISAAMVGLGNVANESKATMFTNPTFTGLTTLAQTTEILETKSGATGVISHDCSTTAIWYHENIAANFTANFVNVPTTNLRTISLTLVLIQGATGRTPTAVQIDGVAQTINWSGGSAPSGNNNKIDVVSFTLIRNANTWIVLGNLNTFG